ncbi:MAG: hypothetical protein ACK5IP_09550 [Paracoccus sp. (in: a-proteobacteria)]
MRLVFAAATTILFGACAANAEGWQNLYMADTGGSRLWQTNDPAEASYVYAAVDSPDGARLIVKCPGQPGETWITIGQVGSVDGPGFLNERSSVSFSADKQTWRTVGNFGYSQSSYSMTVPDTLVREMATGRTLVMKYGNQPNQRKIFSLTGARRALNAVDCNRLE